MGHGANVSLSGKGGWLVYVPMMIQHGLWDGQVLQRQRHQTAAATVRGLCSESGEVRVSLADGARRFVKGWRQRKVGRAARGRFEVVLRGIPVGGPYEITLSVGNESVGVHRLRVGDVWLIAGQSNAQGCGNLRTAPRPHSQVHAMYMDDRWDVAREPIHFLADSPDPVHYEACGKIPFPKTYRDRLRRAAVKGVGFGIFFGREMVRRSGGVPQGLLCAAHGGTSMEQWDPAKKKLVGHSLYGSMLRTVRKAGQPVAGVLWYQGESDASEAAAPRYTPRMRKFVAALRHDLGQPRLPFLLVQIGRVVNLDWAAQARWWNSIQEQQLRLKKWIPNLEVVSAVDLPLDDVIHVGGEGCARLGVRLARLADRMAYGNRREPPAPELESLSHRPIRALKGICTFPITLKFKNVVGGLRAEGTPTGFTLVDANGRDQCAVYKTTLQKNKVILETTLTGNTDGLFLMHGHGVAPHVNLTDGRDMPIPVFPVPLSKRRLVLSPFVNRWWVSRIQPATRPVHQQPPPKPSQRFHLTRKVFEQPFVDQHRVWEGREGQAYFFSEIRVSEPMKLNLRVGYDGPIKVWMDDRPVFQDPKGTNPATIDKGMVPVRLRKGRHRLAVAMDLHGGLAWGFFLRFDRRGLSRAQVAKEDVAMPVCSLSSRLP